jgi:hypothetical protein
MTTSLKGKIDLIFYSFQSFSFSWIRRRLTSSNSELLREYTKFAIYLNTEIYFESPVGLMMENAVEALRHNSEGPGFNSR